MSKYLYTPRDIALYLWASDFPHSVAQDILRQIWENHTELIPAYRKDKTAFYHKVNQLLLEYELEHFQKEADAVNADLNDLGSVYSIQADEKVEEWLEAYFREFKLRLSYTPGTTYVKLKTRTLVNNLRYQRRSAFLVESIRKTLRGLHLETYLRGYEKCNIAAITLDDVVILRLKKEKE